MTFHSVEQFGIVQSPGLLWNRSVFQTTYPLQFALTKEQMGCVYKGQPRWKSLRVDWKAYTEAIENSEKLMKYKENYGVLVFRKNLKELSEEFQTKLTLMSTSTAQHLAA